MVPHHLVSSLCHLGLCRVPWPPADGDCLAKNRSGIPRRGAPADRCRRPRAGVPGSKAPWAKGAGSVGPAGDEGARLPAGAGLVLLHSSPVRPNYVSVRSSCRLRLRERAPLVKPPLSGVVPAVLLLRSIQTASGSSPTNSIGCVRKVVAALTDSSTSRAADGSSTCRPSRRVPDARHQPRLPRSPAHTASSRPLTSLTCAPRSSTIRRVGSTRLPRCPSPGPDPAAVRGRPRAGLPTASSPPPLGGTNPGGRSVSRNSRTSPDGL